MVNQLSICPDCKSNLIHQDGCVQCPVCGWSNCSGLTIPVIFMPNQAYHFFLDTPRNAVAWQIT